MESREATIKGNVKRGPQEKALAGTEPVCESLDARVHSYLVPMRINTVTQIANIARERKRPKQSPSFVSFCR